MTPRKIIWAALTDYKGLILKRDENPLLADKALQALDFIERDEAINQLRIKSMREALEKIAKTNEGNVVKYIQSVDSIALDAIDADDGALLYAPTFDKNLNLGAK